jgi:hypothetical protein
VEAAGSPAAPETNATSAATIAAATKMDERST